MSSCIVTARYFYIVTARYSCIVKPVLCKQRAAVHRNFGCRAPWGRRAPANPTIYRPLHAWVARGFGGGFPLLRLSGNTLVSGGDALGLSFRTCLCIMALPTFSTGAAVHAKKRVAPCFFSAHKTGTPGGAIFVTRVAPRNVPLDRFHGVDVGFARVWTPHFFCVRKCGPHVSNQHICFLQF